MPLRDSSQENVAIVQRNILLKKIEKFTCISKTVEYNSKKGGTSPHCRWETVSRDFP